MSPMIFMDGSGGKMYVLRTMNSFRMSFWMVPDSCSCFTPCNWKKKSMSLQFQRHQSAGRWREERESSTIYGLYKEVEAYWPNGQCACLQTKQSGFEPWLGEGDIVLCYCQRHFFSKSFSPPRFINSYRQIYCCRDTLNRNGLAPHTPQVGIISTASPFMLRKPE